MKIQFNGKTIELTEAVTLAEFLHQQTSKAADLLIEYNDEFINMDDAAGRDLHDGDRIVALSIVGGG